MSRRAPGRKEHEVNENIIRKVKALLATAEHANTPEAEAETAMTMAMMLMGKYAIDEAVVRDRSTRGTVQRRVFRCPAPYSRNKRVLASIVCRAFRCRAVSVGDTVVVFGFEADLDQAEMMFTSLLAQMASAAANVRPPDTWRAQSASSTAAYRRSYMLGWVEEVNSRLRAMTRKVDADAVAEHGADKMALVVQSTTTAVNDALRAEFPRLTSSPVTTGNAGYGAGRNAGAGANLGGSSVRGARAALGR
jgi:Protein of unknown function (DUF2786)